MPTATAVAATRTTRLLADLAQDFQGAWQQRFGRPGVQPCASLEGGALRLRLESAFTPAELELAHQVDGPALVRRRLEKQLDDLYPWLAEEVEARLHCFVAQSRVLLNFADGSITCEVTLRDTPRLSQIRPAGDCAERVQ